MKGMKGIMKGTRVQGYKGIRVGYKGQRVQKGIRAQGYEGIRA